MTKAEKFIKDYTSYCSNELVGEMPSYHEWLTPEQALRAVEIAREEVIEKVCDFLDNDLCCYIKAKEFIIEHERLDEQLKKL